MTGLNSKFDGCFMCMIDASFVNITNNRFENIIVYHTDAGIGLGSYAAVYPCSTEPIVVAFISNNTIINTDTIR